MNLYQIDDGKLRLKFHSGQSRAWQSTARFVFLLAGVQGGKTSFLPWWLYNRIKEQGSGDYIAATTTNDLFKLKFLPEMRKVFESVLKIGRYWAGDRIIEIADPKTGQFKARRSSDEMYARIILRSAQSDSGLASATAKAAILDEVGQDGWTLDDWLEIQARLSLSQGRICGATTLYNIGWLKTEVYDPWLEGDKTFDIIQFSSATNPAFPKEEFERQKKSVQDWRFSMKYMGQFAKPSTLIYRDFDEPTMVVDDFDIPDDWFRIVGTDFGGANTCTIHLAEQPGTGVWYVYLETLSGGKSTREHVNEQLRNIKDAASWEFVGGAPSETQHRDDWSDAGIYVYQPQSSDVEIGIDRVTELIRSDKLRVFRSCRGLRDEFGRYQRKLDPLGNPSDDILNKNHYHRLDGLRYASIHIKEGVREIEPVIMGDHL